MVTNRDRESFGSRRKKFQMLLRRLAPSTFLIRIQAFGTHFAESFRMSKSSWMMDRTRSRETPSCSAIDLAEMRRSSKMISWFWSVISGVVTVLDRPRRGASQVEKSSCLNWATQFLMVTYDCACSPNVLSEWREFPSAPCLAEKKKTWWQLASQCCWNRARRWRASELVSFLAGLRTYQHPGS